MKTSTAALALVIASTSLAACTVLNDMSGYTGGFGDTGVEPVVDTGAKVDSFVPPMDTSTPKDTAVEDTSVVDTTVTDTGMTDTAPVDTGTDTAVADTGMDSGPPGCHVVINEVQTRGAADGGSVAGDEFIELFNPCTSTIDLSGYKVVYRSATGTSDVTVATIASGKSIAASGFFLVGNGVFSTTSDQPFTASGIADDGAAGVRDPIGTLLDSVAWGAVSGTHGFIETAAAPKPAAGASISRVPNGTDTNNNSVDFQPATSSPKS